MRRLRACASAPASILVPSLLPHLHATGNSGAKRLRKFSKIETSHAKRFYKFILEGLFSFLIFSLRFQNHPPMSCWPHQYVKAVNVCEGGRVMGLVRLKKSVRIVNHPPPSRGRSRTPSRTRQGRADPQKSAKSRQLFHLLIISTTVNAIFCCICNSRSSICTTDMSRHLSRHISDLSEIVNIC